MNLSCECGEWDSEWDNNGEWWYIPRDLSLLHFARKKCSSCKKIIKVSETCLKFERAKDDEWGDEVEIEPHFMCKHCGEIFLNLTDIGYCLEINANMDKDLAEYHKITGFVSGE